MPLPLVVTASPPATATAGFGVLAAAAAAYPPPADARRAVRCCAYPPVADGVTAIDDVAADDADADDVAAVDDVADGRADQARRGAALPNATANRQWTRAGRRNMREERGERRRGGEGSAEKRKLIW